MMIRMFRSQRELEVRKGSAMKAVYFGVLGVISVARASFNCVTDIDGVEYDLRALDGIHLVSERQETPPSTTNSTWYINPCGRLDESKIPKEEQCPAGTQICGVKRVHLEKVDMITEVIPVCGDLNGNQGGAKVSKLKDDKEGLQVEMLGGQWGGNKDLGAKIDFICDKNEKSKDNIKFVGWDGKQLSLEWKTDVACKRDNKDKDGDKGKDGDKKKEPEKDKKPEDDKDDDKKSDSGSSWGFFTWLFVLIVLAAAGYVIASAWINYNRYGLTGMDMLPQSDTVRDLPFLIRDFTRKIINTFAGGNRGGYSAV
ncbi:hypothetical protein TRICI_001302 [Trichomonascus ciferrii]|uniref:Autophagy-related protein 27 n=1 Tax=Trichomonascus ciferrii TaxID=44093 RepID=A0A642V9N7_9ASCO|nr:hypothetical protein TRICI_001302 [Trichomonascus ciferrii]